MKKFHVTICDTESGSRKEAFNKIINFSSMLRVHVYLRFHNQQRLEITLFSEKFHAPTEINIIINHEIKSA